MTNAQAKERMEREYAKDRAELLKEIPTMPEFSEALDELNRLPSVDLARANGDTIGKVVLEAFVIMFAAGMRAGVERYKEDQDLPGEDN